ncbi:MAG: YncE family protein, partial [bacterium]|nr:YncE family protein [bacterium]
MKEYLIVLNKDEDSISIVDIATKLIVKTIATDHNPHEVVVSLDGRKTYVTCSLGNTIDVIDNGNFNIIKRITHPDFIFPHGLGLTQDGKRLFMASTRSSKVFVINTETDEITKVIATEQDSSHMISFSPDGKTVYVPNIRSHSITVLDTDRETIISTFAVGQGPEGVAVHPNGHHLYVANQHDNDLYVIDTTTLEVLHKRKIGACPIRVVFSPDGRYALVPNRESGDLT